MYAFAASDGFAMDLYISPLSCSFAVHIATLEAGLQPRIRRVDRKTKRLDDGTDYHTISPKALVPAITLPDGGILTESSAVLQYIADQAPERQLAPAWGTVERYRLIEWLNFVTTELHKKLVWPVFSTKTTPEMKQWTRELAPATFEPVARHLADREFLVGDRFTVADAYLFWALFVGPHGGLSLNPYPALKAYVERIRSRPTVVAVLAIEGPLYAQEAAAGTVPAPAPVASAGGNPQPAL